MGWLRGRRASRRQVGYASLGRRRQVLTNEAAQGGGGEAVWEDGVPQEAAKGRTVEDGFVVVVLMGLVSVGGLYGGWKGRRSGGIVGMSGDSPLSGGRRRTRREGGGKDTTPGKNLR